MNIKKTITSLPTLVGIATCAITLLLSAGCASSGNEKGNKTAASIQAAANNIAALPGEIGKTLASLSYLVNQPAADLRPQYKAFVFNLAVVEDAGREVEDARMDLGQQGKAYFAEWDAQLAKIKNEDIKARSQSRKNEVAQQLQAIKKSYAEAEVVYRPFLSGLKDVQKYLSVDLTPDGVAAIKGTLNKALTDVGPLNASLAKLANDFKALGVAMSSAGPMPAK
jgi:outer membrane murein-binding lipoprotein Lpp